MLSTTNDRLECPKALLIGLARTVEIIIDISVFKQSIFYLSSSKNHLHARIKAILKHGAKIKHHIIYSQPTFAAFDSWLEQCLTDFSLLSILQARCHDLEELYNDWAFLRNQSLFGAFLDVLQVLSTRDVAPLLRIMTMEVNLQLDSTTQSQTQTMPLCRDPLLASLLAMEASTEEISVTSKSAASPAINIPVVGSTTRSSKSIDAVDEINANECKLEFLPPPETVIEREGVNVPNFSYSYQSPVSSPPVDRLQPGCFSRSEINVHELGLASSSNDLTGRLSLSSETQSLTGYSAVLTAGLLSSQISSSDEGRLKKKAGWTESFLESGGMVLPPAIGHFPRPQQGQTLTSFLSSLSENLPDLDRENAHFNVSEALISAFERIKIQKYHDKLKAQQSTTNTNEESGEEDAFGTVQKPTTAQVDHPDPGPSKSPRKHRHFRKDDLDKSTLTETEESELEYWRQPRKPPPYLRKKPRAFSASDGIGVVSQTSSSLTSSEDDFLSSSFSAENVAFNLLRNSRLTDNQIPPASELRWLVSETEVPQALLPLPKVRSGTDTESDYNSGNASTNETSIGKIDNHIRLRGSLDWAPPRPQIIFTVHPSPTINILIKTQRCRCAGCGTRVDVKYASTFRYCYYLGRYFCTGCHTGKKARLPQMIIHQWDFSPYSVSNFSATLLEKLQSDPVYNILAINSTIYKKVKINNFRNYRIQLGILKEYIHNCKSASFLREELDKFPQYYYCDVDLYSLEDLVHLRFSTGAPMKTKHFVAEAIKHVLNCELCKGLGFVCEICNKNETLFPFQINRVTRCSGCASCYQLKCYSPTRISCPKCLRISARRHNLDVQATAVVPGSSEAADVAC